MKTARFELLESEDAREHPVRIAVVQDDSSPQVDLYDDDLVMTFPHLVVRELIALIAVSLFVVLLALLFNAPLEELANPQKTPNPAKAPWYFLGLQELLHYYPPIISGVILPGLVLLSLAVVPYFSVNLKREPFWEKKAGRKRVGVTVATLFLVSFFYVSGAHPVWPIIGATLFVGALMLLPGIVGTRARWLHWLGTRSLAFWIFFWFLCDAVVLTVVGTFFRGPGWSLTLPWRDGIY